MSARLGSSRRRQSGSSRVHKCLEPWRAADLQQFRTGKLLGSYDSTTRVMTADFGKAIGIMTGVVNVCFPLIKLSATIIVGSPSNTYMHGPGKYIQSAFVLPAQAPISALSWYTDSGLQIRLFTVLNNGPNIAQILHEDNDWDDEAKDLVSLSPTVNAVAASRDVKASTDNAISVFYQNTRTAIDCLVTDPPRGIPTSRQS